MTVHLDSHGYQCLLKNLWKETDALKKIQYKKNIIQKCSFKFLSNCFIIDTNTVTMEIMVTL